MSTDPPPVGTRDENGRLQPPDSLTVAEWVARRGKVCLVAFSRGKDSFATVERVREVGLRPVAFCQYNPPLHFQTDDLDRLEREFDMPIIRWPHRALWYFMATFQMQPPDRLPAILANRLRQESQEDIYHHLIATMFLRGLYDPDTDGEVWIATGVRAADSPLRRIAITSHGAINQTMHTFMPIWDYRKADVLASLDRIGIPLPIDYRIWGSTFDGIDAKYLVGLAKHLPEDFARLQEWFPFATCSLDRVRIGRGDRTVLDLATDRDEWLRKVNA